jgi:DNA-binding response OmpR family regulator
MPAGSPAFEEKVLVIDDDPSFRQYLKLLLEHEGAEMCLAGSGEEAFAAIESFMPTMVIADIVLPGMDGLAVCRRLRADPRFRRLPILILTGADHSTDVGEVVGLGLIWYLRKGADWQLIMRTLRNLATRAREMPVAS